MSMISRQRGTEIPALKLADSLCGDGGDSGGAGVQNQYKPNALIGIHGGPNGLHVGPHSSSFGPNHQHQRLNAKAAFFNSCNNNNNCNNGTASSSGAFLQHNPNGGPMQQHPCTTATAGPISPKSGPIYFNYSRQRYTPYYSRSYSNGSNGCSAGGSAYMANNGGNGGCKSSNSLMIPPPGLNTTGDSGISSLCYDPDANNNNISLNGSAGSCNTSGGSLGNHSSIGLPAPAAPPVDNSVTLQISNIDTSIEDRALKSYLIGKLKPITPILSFVYEGMSMVKIRLPSHHHAKQVVAYLHRKKIGHKRITVSYTRDSSTLEPSTLRCQVAGLLKDIPFYKLSMYKFRELFQSRFKTSISVMDLYDMKDICIISENPNEEKFICLRPELISSIENSELLGCLQLSVPYCTVHFKSGHRGWAELDIEPLPNVFMSVSDVRSMVYRLLKNHKGDIPIASLVYCIEAELNVVVERNEKGVNLEHLISCVNGVHITTNKFGIKILSWLAAENVIKNAQKKNCNGAMYGVVGGGLDDAGLLMQPHSQGNQVMMGNRYSKFANMSDPFGQISREIIELIKMSPKATMKFSRFIPAYHNHFGKQCRVADYGYTKLIELFEALTGVVQIMGDGENRQITLTHKCQIRCFTTDLLRVLRSQSSKSVRLAQLEGLFSSTHGRKFDITDYGVCDLEDVIESVLRSNMVSVDNDPDDMILSIPKRRQSRNEIQKTCTFAGEVVELLRNSSQYSILFEKFACSYHYNYGYQCRLSDYGFLKLTDLMDAITGVVEIEVCNDEDRKVYLSPKVAQRIFSEQLRDLTKMITGSSVTAMSLCTLLYYHKKQFGYQMQPQSLGIGSLWYGVRDLPYIELTASSANDDYVVICHHDDPKFLFNGYACCRVILESGKRAMPIADFINAFFRRFSQILNEHAINTMNHAVEIFVEYGSKYVCISSTMMFVLRIIGVLEMMSVVFIGDLKTILNIGISDCFPYGYPHLNAMLQSFSDIFLCSSYSNDMCEIVLNQQCILIKNGVPESLRGSAASDLNSSVKLMRPTYHHHSSSAVEFDMSVSDSSQQMRIKTSVTAYETSVYNNSIKQEPEQENETQPVVVVHPQCANNSQESKEKGHFNLMQSSEFDRLWAEELLFNVATETAPTAQETVRNPLYERSASENYPHCAPDANHLTNSPPPLSIKFDPPKPDTPPSNVPFWMDPVWRQNSVNGLTAIDDLPIKIPIPELNIVNSLPSLDTPTMLANIFNKNPTMFSFDF